MKTGRCTIRPFSVVHSLAYDDRTGKATGVRIIDANTREGIESKAKVIFLCASTLESARILFNSATPGQPTGLGNASDQLGRNLMDHIKGAGASGRVEGLDDKTSFGRRPTGVYIPRFRNLDARSHQTDFIRGADRGWGSCTK